MVTDMLEYKLFNEGEVIFKEGEAADKIYIIKEGEFGLCKKLIHKEKEQDNNIQDILDNP